MVAFSAMDGMPMVALALVGEIALVVVVVCKIGRRLVKLLVEVQMLRYKVRNHLMGHFCKTTSN